MLDINLRQLEIFTAVTEYNSFTKAADALYLSQSTISGYIQSLEETLGVTLFYRENKKRIELTEDGKQIYSIAKDILDKCLLLQERQPEKEQVPMITIASSTVPAQYWLPKCLAEFSRENPECHFLLRRGDSLQVHEMLENKETQMGFVGLRKDDKKFSYTPVFQDELVLITENSPYFQDKGENDGLALLLERPVIVREEESGTWQVAKGWLREQGIMPESLHIVAQLETPDAICRVVKQGMGVAVISALAVEEEVASGKLLQFHLSEERLKRQIYMVLPVNERMPFVLDRFRRFILEKGDDSYGIS